MGESWGGLCHKALPSLTDGLTRDSLSLFSSLLFSLPGSHLSPLSLSSGTHTHTQL
eukprot:NODE_7500_length_237_cov_15.643617_g7417_i0.p2 GENE.NODE_7500_length_237_cov_15.643617_g7417_i0~~NODE_7500_length_237_cov_15.643617_g7417_i0.p2  ORF type:complete len:64 (-),score=39.55 NODE_7500_length_237_cov_15.643617_g7417_i0:46-213(-)